MTRGAWRCGLGIGLRQNDVADQYSEFSMPQSQRAHDATVAGEALRWSAG